MRLTWKHAISFLLLGLLAASAAPARPVRLLPIGDSLTNGVGSSDHGAYRTYVKQAMGDSIDFIGRRQDGVIDPENEGWGSFTINKMRNETVSTIPLHSGFGEVVLLTAGTNDLWWANQGTPEQKAAKALADLSGLVSEIYRVGGSEVQTVFVSSIPKLHDWNSGYDYPEFDLYNAGLPETVSQLAQTHDVRFVNAGAPLNIETDFIDGIHPNDAGYRKMGQAWIEALATVVPEPGCGLACALIALGTLAGRRR